MSDLHTQITSLLSGIPDLAVALEKALALILPHFKSETGTIHRLDAATQQLHLEAQAGLPPHILPIVTLIPVGKGIAGETAAKNQPVTICNIQTDKSGVAKPGAKATGVGGALCVPIRNGTTLVGTLGIGTAREYEYTLEETRALEEIGNLLGPKMAS
jgi:putative methionine-R-sulfoxide reductase with GAF domain